MIAKNEELVLRN